MHICLLQNYTKQSKSKLLLRRATKIWNKNEIICNIPGRYSVNVARIVFEGKYNFNSFHSPSRYSDVWLWFWAHVILLFDYSQVQRRIMWRLLFIMKPCVVDVTIGYWMKCSQRIKKSENTWRSILFPTEMPMYTSILPI